MLMIADESMSHTLQSALSPAGNNTNKHIPECGLLDWKLQFSSGLKILRAFGAVSVFEAASTICLRHY